MTIPSTPFPHALIFVSGGGEKSTYLCPQRHGPVHGLSKSPDREVAALGRALGHDRVHVGMVWAKDVLAMATWDERGYME